MKTVLCEELATCLYMKPPPSPSQEHALYKKSQDVAKGDKCTSRLIDRDDSTPSSPTTEIDSVKELLKEIRDLLKTRVRDEEEQSRKADEEDAIKNDWMLAAAVLNRICAIAFTILFIAGTLICVILFIIRP